jgi:hypothetical protein
VLLIQQAAGLFGGQCHDSDYTINSIRQLLLRVR